MSAYKSAQAASRDIFEFFIDCLPGFEGISLSEVRSLEDRISVIGFYLAQKRRQLEAELLKRTHEYRRSLRNGHVWNHLSGNGSGPDYELPPGQADGELVEVVVRRLSFDSPSRMLVS